MTTKKVKRKTQEQRFEEAYREFQKISDEAKQKAKELLENGTLTPNMLDFEYYDDDYEIEADHTICYADGRTEILTKKYWVEVQIIVKEED